MTRDEVLDLCREEEQAAQTGWSFSVLQRMGRVQLDSPSWDYRELVFPYMREAKAFVDMGIGNGELLAGFKAIPFHANATEKDKGNIDAARIRLAGLGVKVHHVDSEEDLPFQDGYFQLITSCHTKFYAHELARVARKGCAFVTEQICSDDCIALNQHLETRRPSVRRPWTLDTATKDLERAGFIIEDAREDDPEMRFYDAGAVVYYAAHHMDIFPGFSVAKRIDALYALQRHIETRGYVAAKSPRFIIVARKV